MFVRLARTAEDAVTGGAEGCHRLHRGTSGGEAYV